MKKVVITGGAGFIGSELGYELHKLGYKIVLIDNLSHGYKENLIVDGKPFGEFVFKDVCTDSLEEHFKDAYCVFHFAAISSLPECQSDPYGAINTNVGGTARVLEACRKTNVRRVVFASTSAIYENNESFPCSEHDLVNPTLMYSTSKLCAEGVCKSFSDVYGMDIVITRYYNVYGKHQDSTRVSPPFTIYLIRELLNGRQPVLHSDGAQERDYVYIDDVNELNILCMKHPDAPNGIFNVASGNVLSVRKIYEIISNELGVDIKPVYRDAAKFWDKYPHLFEGVYPVQSSRIKKEVNKFTLGSVDISHKILGWHAKTDFKTGIRKTIEGYRKRCKS